RPPPKVDHRQKGTGDIQYYELLCRARARIRRVCDRRTGPARRAAPISPRERRDVRKRRKSIINEDKRSKMPVITILCHGTANSTNRSTSGGSELVISKLSTLLTGTDGRNWILNEGAGTKELRHQANTPGKKGGLMGIVAGEGVEANVARSLRFVSDNHLHFNAGLQGNAPLTVNLAGHSR